MRLESCLEIRALRLADELEPVRHFGGYLERAPTVHKQASPGQTRNERRPGKTVFHGLRPERAWQRVTPLQGEVLFERNTQGGACPGLACCGPLARGSAVMQSAVQALSCGSLLQGIFTPRRFLSRSPCEVTGGAVELSFNKTKCRRCSGCDGADYRISGELRILDLSGTAVGTPDG